MSIRYIIRYYILIMGVAVISLQAEEVESTELAERTVTVDEAVKESVPEGIVGIFDQLNKSAIAEEYAEIGKLIDYDELIELSAYKGMPEIMKEMLKLKLSHTLPETILLGFKPVSTKVIKIDFDEEEQGKCIVTVRHIERDGISSLVRWWIINQNGQWLFYDTEFFDLPIRLSMNLKLSQIKLSNVVSGKQKSALKSISDGLAAYTGKDYWLADEYVSGVLDVELSEDFDMVRNLLRLMIFVAREESKSGLELVERLEKQYPAMPYFVLCRTHLNLQSKNYKQALHYCEAYKRLAGNIADILALEGKAYEGLVDLEKALKCYTDGLVDMPGSLDCLAGYIRLFDGDKKAELEKRFKKIPHLEDCFDLFYVDLVYGEYYDIATIAVEVFKELYPDQDCTMYEAELAYWQEDYLKTIELLHGKRAKYEDDYDLLLKYDQIMFTAYIETQDFENALALAELCYDYDGDPFFLLLAYAYSGEFTQAVECMVECKNYGYTLDALSEVPLFAKMVNNDEVWKPFSEEMNRYAEEEYQEIVSFVLLNSNYIEMDQSILEAIVGEALGIDFSREGDQGQFVVGEGETYIIKLDKGIFMYNNFNSPYIYEDLQQSLVNTESINIAGSQKGWVSVDLLKLSEPEDTKYAYQTIGKILSGVIDGNCVGVFSPSLKQLKANSGDVRNALLSADPLEAFENIGKK